jgi:hypothetical protein
MRSTSHRISSLYSPILNSTKHYLVTVTWCHFCNHETLYGFGCGSVSSSNFSNIFLETKFSVLPLPIIALNTMSFVLQVVLNRLFLCTGFSTSASGFRRTFLNIRDVPSYAPFSLTFLLYASEI